MTLDKKVKGINSKWWLLGFAIDVNHGTHPPSGSNNSWKYNMDSSEKKKVKVKPKENW